MKLSLNRLKAYGFGCAFLAILGGCAHTSPRRTTEAGSTPEIQAPEASPVKEIQEINPNQYPDYVRLLKLFQQGAHGAVVQEEAVIERKYQRNLLYSYLKNISGLSYLALKQPLPAIGQFQKGLDAPHSLSLRPYLLYNQAVALTEADQPEDALSVLSEVPLLQLNLETQTKLFQLKSKLQLQKSQFVEAARTLLEASQTLGKVQVQTPVFQELLDRSLYPVTRPEDLRQILSGLEHTPFAARVRSKLDPLEAQAGEVEESQTTATRSIGVLLPLSGKFSLYGSRALKAISQAFRIYDPNGEDYTLFVEDSGESADQAIRALQKLIIKNKVSVVLGPLLSKGIEQVTTKAESLKTPIFTLSQQRGVQGDYIFSAGLTPQLQAKEIARYAIQNLKIKSFAILHPKDKFGEQYAQQFWDSVENLGGKIAGIESYTPGETDFRKQVDRLVGLFYTDARRGELDDLAKKRAQMNVTRRTPKTAPLFDLPPIVDFEAVFIPDDPKIIGQILPTFAFRDVDQVKFLGVSPWNSKEFLTRAGAEAERSYFVDGLFLDSPKPATQKFINRFQRDGRETPTTIEAMAYDAALWIDKALQGYSAPTIDKPELLKRLRNVSRLTGATGEIHLVSESQELDRSLELLTVRSGRILEAL